MSGNQSINIDVWVVDHRHSSDEERNLDALFPSQVHVLLGNHFQNFSRSRRFWLIKYPLYSIPRC